MCGRAVQFSYIFLKIQNAMMPTSHPIQAYKPVSAYSRR